MRKEAVLAIIAGLGLGLIIAFGVWRMSLFSKKQDASPSPTPSSNPQQPTGLIIAKPGDDAVIATNPANISGLASPGSWIMISGNSADYLLETDSDGVFTGEVKLVNGINQFVVTAVNKESGQISRNLRLIFSGQIDIAPDFPKAYIGIVTDIADTTIQIKSDAGEIQQISADTSIKLTDIAIGDYIAALGTTNGNHVLEAQRILITSPQKPPNIKIYFGPVKELKKKEVTLEEIKFTTKLTGLKLGDLIIVIGELDETGKFTARKSFLASPAPIPSPTPQNLTE